MLKRLSTVAFAILLVVVATAQGMPRGAAMAAEGGVPCEIASLDSAPGSSKPTDPVPCKGPMPSCVGALGCIMIVALPAPIVAAVPGHRDHAAWSGGGSDLTGRSVEPELSPPIRTA